MLLLVFLMASAVALMLYMQLPREAFESERDKEQMLIDRGEQYKRAIYLYYVSNNRQWPSKIEDLESTNNHRYLRQRYVDPYTGKDEWRMIHTNGAFLTDSLVTPPPAQGSPGVQGGALAGNSASPTSQGFSLFDLDFDLRFRGGPRGSQRASAGECAGGTASQRFDHDAEFELSDHRRKHGEQQ